MIICYFRSTISHHFRQSIFTGSPFPPEIDSLIIGQAGSTRKQINSRKIHKHHTHTRNPQRTKSCRDSKLDAGAPAREKTKAKTHYRLKYLPISRHP